MLPDLEWYPTAVKQEGKKTVKIRERFSAAVPLYTFLLLECQEEIIKFTKKPADYRPAGFGIG